MVSEHLFRLIAEIKQNYPILNRITYSQLIHHRMIITTEDLKNANHFKLVKEVKYQDILQFVLENIQKPNLASRFYYFINILVLLTIIILSYIGFRNELFGFLDFLSLFFWGFISGSILIIPFHELFHGIAYKLIGAPKISFGADFKQAIFYVAADQFVVSRKSFYIIALAPFISINLLSIFLLHLANPAQLIGILFFMLFHNIMCIGDFSMISFFLENKNKELFTYDLHKEKTSFVYEKIV
jgi:hypothetical protein